MIQIRFLEVHDDVFHAGKNFGKKFAWIHTLDWKIEKDGEEFLLTYKNRVGHIPMGNVKIWEPVTETPIELPKNEHHTEDKRKRASAQVSTPMGHVFEGQGAGKTGVATR